MDVVIEQAAAPAQWAEAAQLIRAYLDGLGLDVNYQDVGRELAELPSEYGPPQGAGLLVRSADGGAAVGFVGVRRFADGDAELKRMYVDPSLRGTGAGRALAVAAITVARRLGYRRLLLDTVASLTTAIALYESLGFVAIEAYRHNPFPDARYFALDL